jgi:hypothetical protein
LPRPAARLSNESGRPYSRRRGSAFGIAGAGSRESNPRAPHTKG